MNALTDIIQKLFAAPPKPTVKMRSRRPAVVVPSAKRAGGSTKVQPDDRPLWEIRGWRRKGDVLTGAYRTQYGSFAGTIRLGQGAPQFFITSPPIQVLRGEHRPCFRPRGDNEYFIHFGVWSPNVDAGIVAVERLIVRSIRGTT